MIAWFQLSGSAFALPLKLRRTAVPSPEAAQTVPNTTAEQKSDFNKGTGPAMTPRTISWNTAIGMAVLVPSLTAVLGPSALKAAAPPAVGEVTFTKDIAPLLRALDRHPELRTRLCQALSEEGAA